MCSFSFLSGGVKNGRKVPPIDFSTVKNSIFNLLTTRTVPSGKKENFANNSVKTQLLRRC